MFKGGLCAGTSGVLALAGAQTEAPRAVVTEQPDLLGQGDRGERSGGICGSAHAGQKCMIGSRWRPGPGGGSDGDVVGGGEVDPLMREDQMAGHCQLVAAGVLPG